jgi:hypothetical protein
MSWKATLAGAALTLGACVVSPGASWSDTIAILSAASDLQHDPAPTANDGFGVSLAVNEAGFDRPAAGPEGSADLLAIGASSGLDVTAPGSGQSVDNGRDAVASVADPEPSALTRLLLAFSDFRTRVFGGP